LKTHNRAKYIWNLKQNIKVDKRDNVYKSYSIKFKYDFQFIEDSLDVNFKLLLPIIKLWNRNTSKSCL
jgi:hypothetical protein